MDLQVCTELLAIYGTSKRATVTRWIRCYSNLAQPVKDLLRELRSLPDSYVFDNPYLLGPGSQTRSHRTVLSNTLET